MTAAPPSAHAPVTLCSAVAMMLWVPADAPPQPEGVSTLRADITRRPMPFDFSDDADTHPAEQVKDPVVAVRGRMRAADFSNKAGPHRFGGPLGLDVRGNGGRAPALHRVLSLSLADPMLGF